MSGIFPTTGTQAANTTNGVANPVVTVGCEALFYRNNCLPRFDPIATNAMISEILNAVNLVYPYDCSRLDNLSLALRQLFAFCAMPQVAPDTDDFIAGCFDGTNGIAPIMSILALKTLCQLPVRTDPDADDGVAMCVDGQEAQVPFQYLANMVLAQIPPPAAGATGRYRDQVTQSLGNGAGAINMSQIVYPNFHFGGQEFNSTGSSETTITDFPSALITDLVGLENSTSQNPANTAPVVLCEAWMGSMYTTFGDGVLYRVDGQHFRPIGNFATNATIWFFPAGGYGSGAQYRRKLGTRVSL